jgi:hypothetical protein
MWEDTNILEDLDVSIFTIQKTLTGIFTAIKTSNLGLK